MSIFDAAIREGTQTGLVIGFYEGLGVLTDRAEAVLRSSTHKADTPEDRGAREGLRRLGLLKVDWLFRWRITDKGRGEVEKAGRRHDHFRTKPAS